MSSLFKIGALALSLANLARADLSSFCAPETDCGLLCIPSNSSFDDLSLGHGQEIGSSAGSGTTGGFFNFTTKRMPHHNRPGGIAPASKPHYAVAPEGLGYMRVDSDDSQYDGAFDLPTPNGKLYEFYFACGSLDRHIAQPCKLLVELTGCLPANSVLFSFNHTYRYEPRLDRRHGLAQMQYVNFTIPMEKAFADADGISDPKGNFTNPYGGCQGFFFTATHHDKPTPLFLDNVIYSQFVAELDGDCPGDPSYSGSYPSSSP